MNNFQIYDDIVKSIEDELYNCKNALINDELPTLFYSADFLNLFFNRIISLHGMTSLVQFQTQYSNILIKHLSKDPTFEDLIFEINNENNIYFISVYDKNNNPMFDINPFLKVLYVNENQDIISLQNEQENLISQLENIDILIEKLENSLTDFKYYAEDDFALYTKMILNKKKSTQKIQNELSEAVLYKREIEAAINDLDYQINELYYSLSYEYENKDKLINKLISTYGFKIINEINNSNINKLEEIDDDSLTLEKFMKEEGLN